MLMFFKVLCYFQTFLYLHHFAARTYDIKLFAINIICVFVSNNSIFVVMFVVIIRITSTNQQLFKLDLNLKKHIRYAATSLTILVIDIKTVCFNEVMHFPCHHSVFKVLRHDVRQQLFRVFKHLWCKPCFRLYFFCVWVNIHILGDSSLAGILRDFNTQHYIRVQNIVLEDDTIFNWYLCIKVFIIVIINPMSMQPELAMVQLIHIRCVKFVATCFGG